MAWSRLAGWAVALALCLASASCVVSDCAKDPRVAGCTVIASDQQFLSRNQPGPLGVRFLDLDSITALADGVLPTLSLLLPPPDGALQPSVPFLEAPPERLQIDFGDTVRWMPSPRELLPLRSHPAVTVTLQAQLPGYAKSNALRLGLCSSFELAPAREALTPPMSPALKDHVLQALVGLRTAVVPEAALMLCNPSISCQVTRFSFAIDLAQPTLDKVNSIITDIPQRCQIAAFGADTLAKCSTPKPPGMEEESQLLRYSVENPQWTKVDIHDLRSNDFLYASPESENGLVLVANPSSMKALAGESLKEKTVSYALNSAGQDPFVALADMDGDHLIDVVVIPRSPSGSGPPPQSDFAQAAVLLQKSQQLELDLLRTAALRSQLGGLTLGGLLSIAAGDADGDGRVDVILLASDPQDSAQRVLHVLSTSPCATERPIPLNSACAKDCKSLSVGDIDHDGDLDFFCPNLVLSQICVFLNSTVASSVGGP